MKGLVLAGGKGTRLRPFTYSGAKQLVPIANKPVLEFPIEQLVATGITEIALIVGDTEAQIREAMGDGTRFGASLTYIRQPEPAGLAHAVLTARDFLDPHPFVMYLGDNVLLDGIGPFVEQFRETGSPAVILKPVPDPRAFGVGEVASGHLVRMVEKPANPPSDLAVIGIYAFTSAVFPIIERQAPSARGELEIADTINGLIAAGIPVRAPVTASYWIDTGKMEDMLAANRAVLETYTASTDPSAVIASANISGAVVIAEGAVVRSARVIGPAVIGRGAVIENSIVGPYVAVGDGSHVSDSRLENTIVMQESTVMSCPLVLASMIGRFAYVCGLPGGSQVALGDHSRVEVGL